MKNFPCITNTTREVTVVDLQVKQVLELVNQPAFLVKEDSILWCNPIARSLLLEGASLSALLGKSEMLYELWSKEGTLNLPLTIAGKTYDASVQATDEGDLFVVNRRSSEINPTANAAVNISATLRKPLHSMMNAASELFRVMEGQEDPRLNNASSRLNQSIYQFLRLCGQMSDGGRLLLQRKPLHKESTDLNSFFEDFVTQADPLVASLGVSLHFEYLPTPTRGDVDKDLLERALYNLLANALSFTPKGGNITIALKKQRRMLLVSVTDDGEGISPQVLSTLFERFADHSLGDSRWGIGLGLPMVREISQLHGGDLSVAPNPEGKGTCVNFSLSLEPAPLNMRSPGFRYDYSGGLHHGLVELSDVLSAELFNPAEI